MPKLNHTERGITAAHIADKLKLIFGMLIGMTVRTSGLAGKGLHSSVPALFPKVDVGAACVILLLMRDMVSFHKVLLGNLTLTHEACLS